MRWALNMVVTRTGITSRYGENRRFNGFICAKGSARVAYGRNPNGPVGLHAGSIWTDKENWLSALRFGGAAAFTTSGGGDWQLGVALTGASSHNHPMV